MPYACATRSTLVGASTSCVASQSSRVAFVVLAALLLAAPVYAWRSPSPAEHRAIIAAIRKNPAASSVRSFQRVRVSTVDRRFATAVTYPRNKAGLVLSRDAWLLRRGVHGWRVVFVGSDAPPCNIASVPVRRDLLGYATCFSR
jgi:hypothetical protein